MHVDDVARLLKVLHRLVDEGSTVIVIEHNPEVIKTADWLVDLGPEGGVAGGRLLFSGTPEDCARCPDSYTGQALSPLFGMAPGTALSVPDSGAA